MVVRLARGILTVQNMLYSNAASVREAFGDGAAKKSGMTMKNSEAALVRPVLGSVL